jgi:hypothetical protein
MLRDLMARGKNFVIEPETGPARTDLLSLRELGLMARTAKWKEIRSSRRSPSETQGAHSRIGIEMNGAARPGWQPALQYETTIELAARRAILSSRRTRKGGGPNSKRSDWSLPLRGGRAANDRPGPWIDNVGLLLLRNQDRSNHLVRHHVFKTRACY